MNKIAPVFAAIILAIAVLIGLLIPPPTANSQMHHVYTLGTDLVIYKNNVPKIQIIPAGTTTPYQAEEAAERIVDLLNTYATPLP